MRRVLSTCMVVVAMLVAVSLPAAVSASPDVDLARVDRFLADGLGATGIPGAVVAVTRGDEVVFERAYGAAGSDDRFLVGSLSKSFTAVAVLQLAEAGRLDIDRPVQTYLPSFTTADAAAAATITVRHLLNQTSGLADAGFAEVNEPVPDLAGRVASLRAAHPVSPPGREFHYFDPNYQVLARVVEVVSGRPLGAYLRERVFGPLGMHETVAVETGAAARAVPGLAKGHVLVFGLPIARAELDGLLAGSGGVVSTRRDMARWLMLHITGTGPEGQRLLDPALLELTHTPPPGVGGGYGMGWQIVEPTQGPARIEHSGVLSTYSAAQVLLPESGQAFVLLYDANSALADTAGLTAGLAALLTGGAADGVRATSTTALLLGALTLGVAALRLVQAARAPRWAGRHRSPWRIGIGTVWLLVPVAALLALPALLLALAGRRFTLWQLVLAMPDIVTLLAVAAAGGTAVACARLIGLHRQSRRAR